MPVAAIIPAVIGAAGAIGGSLIGSKAAGKAADTQEQAALASIEEQKRQFDINQENMEPWLQTGQLGLSALAQGLGLGEQTGTGPVGYGDLMETFGVDDFEADPGYQFRLSEGIKALDRSAASRGSVLSGGQIKAAERYGSDLASQEYMNAYNRFNMDQTNRYNRLAGISGVGQQTAEQLGVMGQNYADNISNINQNAANARASGYINSANAWNQGIGGASNSIMNAILLSQILKGNGGTNTWTGGPVFKIPGMPV